MGAGKTTVGQKLAQRLGWTFRDLDEVVEDKYGKSIGAIFAEHGETEFRSMETVALQGLLDENDSGHGQGLVIALGGGAITLPRNRDVIERSGALTILLEAPLEELKRRIGLDGKTRPLAASDQAFTQLFVKRQADYHLIRHRVQTVDKTIEQVAAELESVLVSATKPEVVQ
jgi:shikimate kinase